MSDSKKHKHCNTMMGFKIAKALWRLIWQFIVNVKTCMAMQCIYSRSLEKCLLLGS